MFKMKDCNICRHAYHSSCIDNVLEANICKQIYVCVREFLKHLDDNNEEKYTNIKEQNILLDMNATSSNPKSDQNLKIIN